MGKKIKSDHLHKYCEIMSCIQQVSKQIYAIEYLINSSQCSTNYCPSTKFSWLCVLAWPVRERFDILKVFIKMKGVYYLCDTLDLPNFEILVPIYIGCY